MSKRPRVSMLASIVALAAAAPQIGAQQMPASLLKSGRSRHSTLCISFY